MQTEKTDQATSGQIFEYLLFISPPTEVKKDIMEIKETFNDKHNHIQAVKSKPHNTLINFGFNTVFERHLVYKIDEVVKFHSSFECKLNGFNHFHSHTIYINVETELPIINLVRSLHATLGLPPSQSFFAWKPHVTVAKGLDEKKFNAAMPEYSTRKFEASFLTDKIILMKRNTRFAKYEMVKEFQLAN